MKKILYILFIIALCCSSCFITSCECDHSWSEWGIDKQATCAAPGERHCTCTKCGYVLTRKTYKEHQYINNKCELCGKIAPDHTYIKFPSEPLILTDNDKTAYRISEISASDYYYTSNGNYSRTIIQLKIEKIADSRGDNYSRSCTVGYKIYASDNQVVVSGSIYSEKICVNEFSISKESIYGLELEREYRLELLSIG